MRALARPHPTHGWLRLERHDYRRSLDRLCEERDRLNDPSRSEPAPEYHRWVEQEELPQLLRRDFYKRQAETHLAVLDDRIEELTERIQRTAGQLQDEAARLSVERLRLLRAMGEPLEGDDEQE